MCFYAGMNLKNDFSKYHLAPEEIPAFKEYLTPANLAWAIIQRRPISELVEEFHDYQKWMASGSAKILRGEPVSVEAQAHHDRMKNVWRNGL